MPGSHYSSIKTNLHMNNKWFLSIVLPSFLLLFIQAAFVPRSFAQETEGARTVLRGTVQNSKGQPLQNVSVLIKGKGAGTQTDRKGAFRLEVQPDDVLEFSIVGYVTQEQPVSGKPALQVMLQESAGNLDQIVVTGYSSQRRKDITGSVSVVDVDDMKTIPTGNANQMLQGQASGVDVIGSGQPGGYVQVQIRGINSFGDNDPLVIIDGVPASLQDISANDIASVQVLKDAGAASVYGVRGSNGVIVVTTKKGKSGRSILTYDGFYGTQRPLGGNPFHLLNTPQLANLEWEADINSGQVGSNGYPVSAQYGNGPTPVIPDYILPAGAMAGDPSVNPDLYNISNYLNSNGTAPLYQIVEANKTGTDWFHALFRPAPMQSHTISASGGSENATYFFSMNYYDQQGTVIATHLKRYAVRANTSLTIKRHVRVGENAYLYYKDNPQISNNTSNNPISEIYQSQPIIPVYDIMGNFAGTAGQELGNSSNPVATQVRSENNKAYTWDMVGNVWGEVDIIKHLMARTSFGGTMENGYNLTFYPQTYESDQNAKINSLTQSSYYTTNWTWTNSLTYNNTFAGAHSIKAFVATEAISDYGNTIGGTRLGLPFTNPSYLVLNSGDAANQSNYGYVTANQTLYSLIGRVDYGYKDKYLAAFTLRRDQSSVFGSNKQTGFFPAASAGWRMTQEKFLRNVRWLDELKLRGSYGVLGNQNNVPSTNAYTLFTSNAGNGIAASGTSYYDINGTGNSSVQGFYPLQFGNPNTGWEKDIISNIGADAVAFHHHLDLTVEYYRKKISGLLFQDQAPEYALGGAIAPSVNIGDIQNTGVDVSATYHARVGAVQLNLGTNITTYKSLVVSIPGTAGYFDGGETLGGFFSQNQVGHPVGEFYGYKVIGLFKSAADVAASPTQTDAAAGRFKYADVNKDGTIDDNDRTFIGNPNPKFTYGFNLSASWNNFDIVAVLYGSYGNDLVNETRYYTDFVGNFPINKSKDAYFDSWTPQHLNAKVPVAENSFNFSNGAVPSSYYLESGSFLRCKSLVLGYTVSPKFLSKIGVDHFRIYAQGTNLFTVTKYTGLDPEIGGAATGFGIDYGANYPNNQKTYILGVNVSF